MEDKFNLPKITNISQLATNAPARQLVEKFIEQYGRKHWSRIAIHLRLYNIDLSPNKLVNFARILNDYTKQQQSDMYRQALVCKFNYLLLNEYFTKIKISKSHFNKYCRYQYLTSIRRLNSLFLRNKIQTNAYFNSGRITTLMVFFQLDELKTNDINIQGIIESSHKLLEIMIKFQDIYNAERTQQYSILKELTNKKQFTQIIENLIYTNEIVRIADRSIKQDDQILQLGNQNKYPKPLVCKLLKKTIIENQQSEFYQWIFQKLSNKSVVEKYSNITSEQPTAQDNLNLYVYQPFKQQNKNVGQKSKISTTIKPVLKPVQKMETFMTSRCQKFHDDIQRDIQDAEEQDSFNNLFDHSNQIDDGLITKQMEKNEALRKIIETKTMQLRLEVYKEYQNNLRTKFFDNLKE